MDHHQTITSIKAKMGSDLAILSHHYQADSIVKHADITGDSLELARKIPGLTAKYIVFCGVFFMAESAAILRAPHQQVFLPDATASCALADMATAGDTRRVLDALGSGGKKVIPLTYVNSSAAVKAVVGAADGSVCTSANAEKMLQWALDQGHQVLFLPDRNLARNAAHNIGLAEADIADVDLAAPQPSNATLHVWPGYCPIHEIYAADTVAKARAAHPDALIAVHPECPPQVVRAVDGAGSTSYLIKYAADAPEGSTLLIGTETNLVLRLAEQYKGRKTILPLEIGYCEDMAKITPDKLARLLSRLDETEPPKLDPVEVDPALAEPARLALTRMLEASK